MAVQWGAQDARQWIAIPVGTDDKYSRGVLGVVTGSERYPGAAVLGVEAAARTGVGMIRYLGSERPTDYVLRRRPEVVTVPGRVHSWLIGSGMVAGDREPGEADRLMRALDDRVPLVIDAGALDLVTHAAVPVVITPHYGELARTLTNCDQATPVSATEISADPVTWASRAAALLNATVLVKGHTTHVVSPSGTHVVVQAESAWLATAGSGDVLGGIMGALLATHSDAVHKHGHDVLVPLAATAAWIHARAGEHASKGGPLVALDIAEAVPAVIRELLSDQLLLGVEKK